MENVIYWVAFVAAFLAAFWLGKNMGWAEGFSACKKIHRDIAAREQAMSELDHG